MGRWLGARWAALALGVAAAVPVVVSTVRAVADGWFPFGDRAVIALRSLDVLSSHPPLVGQYTQWSLVLGRAVFSPGPLLYWLLVVPARVVTPAGLAVWMGTVNVIVVVGIVLLARRRGGTLLMILTAMLVALMFRSLPSESLHDPWNPYAALLPFLLLCFSSWSVACGEYRLLPLTVLLVSFVIQTHLTYLGPGLALLGVALGGLIISLRRERLPAVSAVSADLRRWLALSVIVLGVCWVLPVANELLRSHNMTLIARALSHRGPTFGLSAGWHTIARGFGVPPWWLRAPLPAVQRFSEVAGPSSFLSQFSAIIVIAALMAVLVVSLRRRRQDTAALAVIALLLVIMVGGDAALTPTAHALELDVAYTLWWASLAGMFVWLALLWSAYTLATERGPHAVAPADHRASRPSVRMLWLIPASVLLTTAVGVIVGLGQAHDADRGEYRPFARLANELSISLPHPGTVLVTASPTLHGAALQHVVVNALPTIAYALRRQGATVRLPSDGAATLGSQYQASPGLNANNRLVVTLGRGPGSGRVVASATVRPPASPSGTYSVVLEAKS